MSPIARCLITADLIFMQKFDIKHALLVNECDRNSLEKKCSKLIKMNEKPADDIQIRCDNHQWCWFVELQRLPLFSINYGNFSKRQRAIWQSNFVLSFKWFGIFDEASQNCDICHWKTGLQWCFECAVGDRPRNSFRTSQISTGVAHSNHTPAHS